MGQFEHFVVDVDARLAVSPGHSRLEQIYMYFPAAVSWNRLEGRSRTNDLLRPMRAEIRDPLWMLARQWQLGEFQAEDAGAPIQARLSTRTSKPSRISFAGRPPVDLDLARPLEVTVERTAIEPDLMSAIYLGRRWLKQLDAAVGDAQVKDSFLAKYAFPSTDEAVDTANRLRDAHDNPDGADLPRNVQLDSLYLATYPRELTLRRAMKGRGLDGAALLADIRQATQDGVAPSTRFAARGVDLNGQEAAVDAAAGAFAAYWSGTFAEPRPDEEAWLPPHLEHNFQLHVPEGDRATSLIAEQYPGGHLDWYSFDSAPAAALEGDGATEDPRVKTFVPTPVRFAGVPNARWWEFEANEVGFGITSAAKTDIVKMLLAEFGLVFSNDWFVVPMRAEVGSLIENRGIVVTDNFGFRTYVEPTARRQEQLHLEGSWGMWTISRAGQPSTVDARVFVAPSVSKSLETGPSSEVVFLRDEMANLVWGVETIIPDALGGGRDGRIAGKRLREALLAVWPPPKFDDLGPDVLLRYSLMGTAPENWIPFVSVTLAGAERKAAFLQGAMPRLPPLTPAVDEGGNLILDRNVVLPRGTLLARDPVANPNLVYEEEVLREGAIVDRTVQRARSADGRIWTWSGRGKSVGRGEGSSGLAFDQALTGPPEPPNP